MAGRDPAQLRLIQAILRMESSRPLAVVSLQSALCTSFAPILASFLRSETPLVNRAMLICRDTTLCNTLKLRPHPRR